VFTSSPAGGTTPSATKPGVRRPFVKDLPSRLAAGGLGLALALVIMGACRQTETEVVKIEGENFQLGFPRDEDFLLIRFDSSNILGVVRIFGDGRVAVHKMGERPGSEWEDFEFTLPEDELKELIKSFVQRVLVGYNPEEANRKAQEAGISLNISSSDSSSASVEIHLAWFRVNWERGAKDYHRRVGVQNLGLLLHRAKRFAAVPEFLERVNAFQEIRELTQDPRLRPVPVEPVDLRDVPSWAEGYEKSDAQPRVLYFQRGHVWSVSALGSDNRHLSSTGEGDTSYVQAPSISPDGSKALLRDVGSGLVLVNLNTGTNRPFVEDATHGHSPVWSPTGDMVVFSGGFGEREYRLVGVDSDGSNPRFLSDIAARPLDWSPDGKKIYFVESSSRRAMERRVFVMNRDGSGKQAVFRSLSSRIRVSPSGRRAAFTAIPPLGQPNFRWRFRAAELNPETGIAANYISTPLLEGVAGFDWSPDGQWLVFTHGCRLGIVNSRTREVRTLLEVDVGHRCLTHANWSPDGRAIAFVKTAGYPGSYRSGEIEVWVMGSDGSDPRIIANGYYPHWLGEAVAPDWYN